MSWLWRFWFWLMCEGDDVTPETWYTPEVDVDSPALVLHGEEDDRYYVRSVIL